MRKLNRQMRKHRNYREGMRVTKIEGTLYEMTPPESADAGNPQALREFASNPALQRVLWDSEAVVRKKYYYLSESVREKMLPRNFLFRLSREGRRSVLLQSRLHTLHHTIAAYRRAHGTWPADVAELIRSHNLRDPWKTGELLDVTYTVPGEAAENSKEEGVLAEYVREGKRKFILYATGRQETWQL